MKNIDLGKTGMKISPVVFGTLPLGPLQANLSPEEGGKLIRYALEKGVNILDTAALYGTYPHIKAGLAGYKGEVIIATKTHANDPVTARQHVETGLKELGIEQFDIVHMHCARVADPFTERAEVLEELLKMKQEGKIKHAGLSSHFICAVKKAAKHPEIEVIHPLINRTGMGILDGTAQEMVDAIALCTAAGTGVYAMKALAGGNLISEARKSLAYILGIPEIHGVAIGMLSEAEIDANIRLFETGETDNKTWEVLESKKRHLAIMKNFCKGCGECVKACASDALKMVNGKPDLNEEACILCGYCGAECPEFVIRVI
ncbi:MAG: aldo/keto reductase [Desulfuromonadales bacterium]|nr:aldo/keto reductase [Desulfuromonadales bacterium]